MVSVKCLSALLTNISNIHTLGLLLGIGEETLAAIQSYYKNEEDKICHIVTLWLMRDPNDPVSQLRDALNSLKRQEIAQTLVLLTSLGMLHVRLNFSLVLRPFFAGRRKRPGIHCSCMHKLFHKISVKY